MKRTAATAMGTKETVRLPRINRVKEKSREDRASPTPHTLKAEERTNLTAIIAPIAQTAITTTPIITGKTTIAATTGQEGRPSYGENNGYQPRGDFQQRRTFSNGFQRENRWNKQRDYSRKDYNGGNDYGNNYQQRYTDRTKQGEDYRNYSQQEFGNRPARPNSTYNNSGKFGYNNSEKFGYNRNNNRPYSPQRNKFTPKKRFDYKEQKYDPNEPIRLNKYLANAGLCSRRDADKYIAAGVVL